MKMLSARTIAALALGLTLTGTVAHAADYPGRGNQDATTNTQQNDQNDRDHKRGKKPAKVETAPVQTGPIAAQQDRRANGNDRRNNPNFDNKNRRHVDMARWHRNMNAQRRYRISTYQGPRDYRYRRWSFGQRLPRVYYARNYWLMDFIRFGLLSPPDGYVWVRYGPDALLIDEETGEIVQVQYNVFYS